MVFSTWNVDYSDAFEAVYLVTLNLSRCPDIGEAVARYLIEDAL